MLPVPQDAASKAFPGNQLRSQALSRMQHREGALGATQDDAIGRGYCPVGRPGRQRSLLSANRKPRRYLGSSVACHDGGLPRGADILCLWGRPALLVVGAGTLGLGGTL